MLCNYSYNMIDIYIYNFVVTIYIYRFDIKKIIFEHTLVCLCLYALRNTHCHHKVLEKKKLHFALAATSPHLSFVLDRLPRPAVLRHPFWTWQVGGSPRSWATLFTWDWIGRAMNKFWRSKSGETIAICKVKIGSIRKMKQHVKK